MREHPQKPYTVEETARFFGCSRSLIYKAIKSGELPSVRLGAKYFVPTARFRL